MNFALFKQELKAGWKVFVIIAAVLALYAAVIVYMYDPELSAALDDFYVSMPELMNLFGMTNGSSDLLGFLISYLYGMLFLVLPLVMIILSANRRMAAHCDRGSLAFLLAAPNTRRRVAATEMWGLIFAIVLMVAYCAAVTIVCAALMFPGELAIGEFLLVNAGLLCLQLFVGALCFTASCLSNDTRLSLLLGAGIPVLEYLILMLANMGGKLESLQYATFYSLFDAYGLAAGEGTALLMAAILLAAAILLYSLAVIIFCRRDLHI